VYVHVKPDTLLIDAELISKVQRPDSKLIIAVNLFGQTCDVNLLETLSRQYDSRLIFISDLLFGEKFQKKLFGNFGDLEIFSFHESMLISGGDGACVCTNNDLTAAKLRNIRSSYGSGPAVPIPYTGNGRMSEIQAGLILNSLSNLKSLKLNFAKKLNFLQDLVNKLEGVSLFGSFQDKSATSHDLILAFDNSFEEKIINDLFAKMLKVNKHIVRFKLYGKGVKPPPLVEQEFIKDENFRQKAIGIPPSISFDSLVDIGELLKSFPL
jgi:dTDP-4-amino-4,6-dideoxygalactose transaminase